MPFIQQIQSFLREISCLQVKYLFCKVANKQISRIKKKEGYKNYLPKVFNHTIDVRKEFINTT